MNQSNNPAAPPPAPDGQVLSLVAALSNAQNHALHMEAIRARDDALSQSIESYGHLCVQLSYLMAGCDDPQSLLWNRIPPEQLQHFAQSNAEIYQQLQADVQQQQQTQSNSSSAWTPFGQMAGLVLKNALMRPPLSPHAVSPSSSSSPQRHQATTSMYLSPPASDHVKSTLLYCLGCAKSELRNVASTVIATTAVSRDSLQPALALEAWPQLIPTLVQEISINPNGQASSSCKALGCLATLSKMMEDGPHQIPPQQMDNILTALLTCLEQQQKQNHQYQQRTIVLALQSIVACLTAGLLPSALVAHFDAYLSCLSQLTQHQSPSVRKLVCRSIVTLLSMRTEYLQSHMEAICGFMCQCTGDLSHPDVALEACEFWTTFASLGDEACTPDMVTHVATILPLLVPTLLRGMVYLPDQQEELLYRNSLEAQGVMNHQAAPVFHRSKTAKNDGNSDDEDDDDNEADFDDDEGNSWTLRKCCAASLDCLAGLYGPEGILPPLLPALEQGLSNPDPWIQEASILALGAVSTGCEDALAASTHLAQLHPYLLNILSTPEDHNTGNGSTTSSTSLPQLKSIAAWTVGRYAEWAVGQVQSGAQGHLLAHMTEIFLALLGDRNRKTQIACCSAFGILIEQAGDMMIPYLGPVFQGLTAALGRYQGRSLLIVLDDFGIAADCVGPAIGEGNLPEIYMPTLLALWDTLAKQDPTDKTLVPLLECLASIALVCGNNFQPYGLQTFENSMATIEAVTLHFTVAAADGGPDAPIFETDIDADVIVCAADVIDGMVEGFGSNFPALLGSSSRYGNVFTNVLKGLTQHEVAGVRMSAFAIMGDLARNAPDVLEPALAELLREAVNNLDPKHPHVCNNSIWAIGEICLRYQGSNNPAPLQQVAPDLVQAIIGLLMHRQYYQTQQQQQQGLAENTACTAGRLALVDTAFVATDLPRFLHGWCEGLAKISDSTERRDGFQGLVKTLYANPGAIHTASTNPADSIAVLVYATLSWHMPENATSGNSRPGMESIQFQPFPNTETDIQNALGKLLHDIKTSVGDTVWSEVEQRVPVNVRKFLRETYRL